MRSDFDAQGYDVVFDAGGIIRHVQLKASVEGGARRHVDINVKLRSKPSGCVVWITYDPLSLDLIDYRWFGGAPGDPLPELGDRVTRHTKGDMAGLKGLRPSLRNVAKSKFAKVDDLKALAVCLFGPARSAATSLVLAQLRTKLGSDWRQRVAALSEPGRFPESLALGKLVDGEKVLEQLCELDEAAWRLRGNVQSGIDGDGDLGMLWTRLSLEHRRRSGATSLETQGASRADLDALTRKLVASLAEHLGPRE